MTDKTIQTGTYSLARRDLVIAPEGCYIITDRDDEYQELQFTSITVRIEVDCEMQDVSIQELVALYIHQNAQT